MICDGAGQMNNTTAAIIDEQSQIRIPVIMRLANINGPHTIIPARVKCVSGKWLDNWSRGCGNADDSNSGDSGCCVMTPKGDIEMVNEQAADVIYDNEDEITVDKDRMYTARRYGEDDDLMTIPALTTQQSTAGYEADQVNDISEIITKEQLHIQRTVITRLDNVKDTTVPMTRDGRTRCRICCRSDCNISNCMLTQAPMPRGGRVRCHSWCRVDS